MAPVKRKRDLTSVFPDRKPEPPPLPPEPKASPEEDCLDPDETPLPQGRQLGEVGLKIWGKLTKLLKDRKNLKPDYLEALFTLCTLEQTAHELRESFTNDLIVESKFGNIHVNGAVGYWSKVVDQLKAYYMEFNLTPRSATKEASEQAKMVAPPVPPPAIETLRTAKGINDGGMFEGI